MLETSPAKEKAKVDTIYTHSTEWRDRMEDDYELWRMDWQGMSSDEGKWDEFTDNYARVLADYVINALFDAKRRLWIPMDAEKKKERTSLSNTERFATGALHLADRILTSSPETNNSQSSLTWDGTIRGAGAGRYFMWQDDDGEVVSDLEIWDPLHLYWISGTDRKGFRWTCYRSFLTKEDAVELYGGFNGAVDPQTGLVTKYNVFDREQEGTFIDNEWVREPEDHNLDHIPVWIRPVGAMRQVRSTRHKDTYKDWAESVFAADRKILPKLHRLLTYYMTEAGRAAKPGAHMEYDGSGGSIPPEVKIYPGTPGVTSKWDSSKGQKWLGFTEPPNFQQVVQMFQIVEAKASMGGIAPIALGTQNQSMTASGTSMLIHAAMGRLKPVRHLLEDFYEWVAREAVSQFANNDFGDMKLEGVDKSGQEFSVELSKKDLDPNWRFRCKIKPDLPQDEQLDIAMATQLIEAGLSPQTAWDKFDIVEDPDLEMEKAARFRAEQFANLDEWEMVKKLHDDRQHERAEILTQKLLQGGAPPPDMSQMTHMQIFGGEGGQRQRPGTPQIQRPNNDFNTLNQAQAVPPEMQQAIRDRRARR